MVPRVYCRWWEPGDSDILYIHTHASATTIGIQTTTRGSLTVTIFQDRMSQGTAQRTDALVTERWWPKMRLSTATTEGTLGRHGMGLGGSC